MFVYTNNCCFSAFPFYVYVPGRNLERNAKNARNVRRLRPLQCLVKNIL